LQSELAGRIIETTAGGVHNATEIEHVIKSFAQKPNGGLVTLPYAVTVFNASTIIALARKYQLPDIYALAEFVAAGGLVSYGPSLFEAYRLVGVYTGKILRGAPPADLPVEQASKVDLVINLNATKAFQITVPITVMGRADEVIE